MNRRTRRKKVDRPEKTTVRSGISGIESEALKDYLRNRCGGLTIDEALKQALDMWLEKGGHTTLAELTEKYKTRRETQDGFIQEELF